MAERAHQRAGERRWHRRRDRELRHHDRPGAAGARLRRHLQPGSTHHCPRDPDVGCAGLRHGRLLGRLRQLRDHLPRKRCLAHQPCRGRRGRRRRHRRGAQHRAPAVLRWRGVHCGRRLQPRSRRPADPQRHHAHPGRDPHRVGPGRDRSGQRQRDQPRRCDHRPHRLLLAGRGPPRHLRGHPDRERRRRSGAGHGHELHAADLRARPGAARAGGLQGRQRRAGERVLRHDRAAGPQHRGHRAADDQRHHADRRPAADGIDPRHQRRGRADGRRLQLPVGTGRQHGRRRRRRRVHAHRGRHPGDLHAGRRPGQPRTAPDGELHGRCGRARDGALRGHRGHGRLHRGQQRRPGPHGH
ncbi:hypothetical protein FQZ97_802330 [compost metagenome]